MMIVGLLAASAVLVFLGQADVNHALTYSGRLIGSFLLTAGITAFLAAISVALGGRLGRRAKSVIALLGVLATLSANLLLLSFQIGEYAPWLWLWLGLIVWSCWALWDLLHRQRAWDDIPRPRNIAAVVSVTAIIAVANFGYAQIYEPYVTPVTVTAAAKFGTPHTDKGVIRVPLVVKFENSGKVAAHVLGATYEVLATTWTSIHDKPKSLPQWMDDLEFRDSGDLQTYTDKATDYVIGFGMVLQPGYWLNPGEKVAEERVVELPAQEYRAIKAQSEVIFLRKDRMSLGVESPQPVYSWSKAGGKAPDWVTSSAGSPRDSEYVKYSMPVKYGSQLLNLIRRPRVATVWWMLGTENEPSSELIGTLMPKGAGDREPTSENWQEMIEYSIVTLASSTSEMIL